MFNKKIAIIDIEGISVKTGGSNRQKQTTIWISKAHLIIWDCKMKCVTFNGGWKIAMPIEFSKVDKKTRMQWNYTHKIHNSQWNQEGVLYSQVLKKIKEKIKGAEVWAKGKFLEDRFLNNKGMYGESICQRQWTGREIYVNELNDLGIKKFDDAMYQYYKWIQEVKGISLKYGSVGDIVMRRNKNDVIPHDPKRECEYFLGELLNHKKKI